LTLTGDQNLSLEMAYRIAAYFEKLIREVFPLLEEHLPSLSEMRELPQ
jgi:DNA-binding XRE family transcriptional regulator